MSIPIDFLKRPSFFSTASLRSDTSFPFMYKAHLKATLHFEIVAKGNNKKVSSFLVNCKKWAYSTYLYCVVQYPVLQHYRDTLVCEPVIYLSSFLTTSALAMVASYSLSQVSIIIGPEIQFIGDVVAHCWRCGGSLLVMWWLIVWWGGSLLVMWWLIVGDEVAHCWWWGGSLLVMW